MIKHSYTNSYSVRVIDDLHVTSYLYLGAQKDVRFL